MMRMIVMLTTVVVLGSASVVAAECAWVLWSKQQTLGGDSQVLWKVVLAYEELEGCRAGLVGGLLGLEANAQREGMTVLKTAENHISIESHGKTEIWAVVCLPDTIDPREKKE